MRTERLANRLGRSKVSYWEWKALEQLQLERRIKKM